MTASYGQNVTFGTYRWFAYASVSNVTPVVTSKAYASLTNLGPTTTAFNFPYVAGCWAHGGNYAFMIVDIGIPLVNFTALIQGQINAKENWKNGQGN